MQKEESRQTPPPLIDQRTFAFALRIVRVCQAKALRVGVGQTLARQVLRSGTSIGANVAEAQAAQSRADFIAKMSVAQKEARETCYWLALLAESGSLSSQRLTSIRQEADEINRILAVILIRTKENTNL